MGVAAVLGSLLFANLRISSMVRGGGDFLSAWAGARAFIWAQDSPYSPQVAALAQDLVYGRAAIPGENPYRLTVPFFLLPLFFPFALVQTAVVAKGIWLCLNQIALAGCTVASLALVEWRPPRGLLLVIASVVLFGLCSVVAMVTGTCAILLALGYVLTLRSLQTGRDELAGTLLALTFFMWEVGVLFLAVMLWWVILHRRWRVFAGLAMTLVTLLGVSFLIYPGWLLPFVTSTVGQLRSGYGATTAAVLARLVPANGLTLAHAATIFLLSLMVYEWWSGRDQDFRRFIWTALLALAITPLLGFRTEFGNLVAVVPSVVLICAAFVQRSRVGGWLASVVLTGIFVMPWFLFGRWLLVGDRLAYDYLFLFYPIVSILGLYWTRSWFIRPRRTWLDEVRSLRSGSRGSHPDMIVRS